jgi:hypothetical protein
MIWHMMMYISYMLRELWVFKIIIIYRYIIKIDEGDETDDEVYTLYI